MTNEKENSGDVSRKSFRFQYAAPVDIVRGTERHSFGTMINVSRGGAAFRAYAPLQMGAAYEIHIRGLGSYPVTVVRRFNGECYAARFDVEEAVKRRIDKALAALFGAENQGATEKTRFSA
ncbi:PilZ domain-containing protein [Hyphococcus sp.]|uniref:PilZ domain-containing protein n=1 Tax=Hyphococcus sp. TaxID=2038636 RepID=UPI0035C754A0